MPFLLRTRYWSRRVDVDAGDVKMTSRSDGRQGEEMAELTKEQIESFRSWNASVEEPDEGLRDLLDTIAACDAKIEALRAPGPCGKHPKMFWNIIQPAKEYRTPPVYGCTLCAEQADLRGRMEAVAPIVEFYLKREIESPSNHQEFAREAAEKLARFRAALDAPAGKGGSDGR
jgi:hypothetical protein